MLDMINGELVVAYIFDSGSLLMMMVLMLVDESDRRAAEALVDRLRVACAKGHR